MKKFLFLVLLLCLGLTACGGQEQLTSAGAQPQVQNGASTAPVNLHTLDLVGSWEMEDSTKELDFTADISDDTIRVSVKLGETTGLYWVGTLSPPPNADEPVLMNSLADREEMSSSMYASQSTNKVFTYEDDKLAFDFTIMGVTRTIYLERH